MFSPRKTLQAFIIILLFYNILSNHVDNESTKRLDVKNEEFKRPTLEIKANTYNFRNTENHDAISAKVLEADKEELMKQIEKTNLQFDNIKHTANGNIKPRKRLNEKSKELKTVIKKTKSHLSIKKDGLEQITETMVYTNKVSNNEERTKEKIIANKSLIRAKREVNETKLNSTINSTEECVGSPEYCYLTKEEYMEMMNNYIYPQNFEWVLIAAHSFVFIAGLMGNALVCIAVYRNHSMRTVTNYFIVNLAVADFMVILFCLPPTVLWDVTETWFFGAAMCKIILYIQAVSVTVSVQTLTFISVDRWYAICYPLKYKSTKGRAKIAIVVIWTIALTFNAPELVILTTEQLVPLRFELQYLMQCVATWSSEMDFIWHIIKIVLVYTVPLILMTVAHYQIVKVLWRSDKIPGQADTAKLAPAENSQLRSRRKAAKMLAAVVVMFAVCYFPVHVLSMLRYTNIEQTEVVTLLALISHVLCYANSAVNPLIYNFMNGKFRSEFRRAFCCPVESSLDANSTTMSRLTMSRKRPCELVALDSEKRSSQAYSKNTMF